MITSCKENSSNQTNVTATSIKSSTKTELSNEKPSITITFESGIFEGTYTFYPDKKDYGSQINIGLNDGISNLNTTKIIAKNGMQVHYITRPFIGESNIGSYKAKKYTDGCGHFNFIDLKNTKEYNRIDGDFSGCTETVIDQVGKWKSGTIYNKRLVSGHFTDTVVFDIEMDDGPKKSETTKVKVKFVANDLRRKDF